MKTFYAIERVAGAKITSRQGLRHVHAAFIGKVLLLSVALTLAFGAGAATTINSTNHFAYGANSGWVNWHGDVANGAVIGEFVCSGFIYSGNVGWIGLGSAGPTNRIRYQNLAANDFGVNHDGAGNLRGFAYGANIGWIQFEDTGAPAVDLKTGNLSGFVFSANCGWISLSNAFARVQTDSLDPGADLDGDGIPDAWEVLWFGNVSTADATSDFDGDGVPDIEEHLADTNPLDADDHLRITEYSVTFSGGNDTDTLTWLSQPTRCYLVQYRTNLSIGTPWLDATGLFLPDPGPTTTLMIPFGLPSTERYFRVQAAKPLSP
jgi:hypothetical protein